MYGSPFIGFQINDADPCEFGERLANRSQAHIKLIRDLLCGKARTGQEIPVHDLLQNKSHDVLSLFAVVR
jgi:hypothetical protein